ncbi:MAG: ribose 5-phosphate isomerase B [Myxococcales bacterium]
MTGGIAIGCDHAGFSLAREIVARLRDLGRAIEDFGTNGEASVDYPEYAEKVARSVAAGRTPLGILVCGTGIGMSMAANKVRGVRAALCHTEWEARLARAHNDANVLCLGGRVLGQGLALAIVEAFLAGRFEGGRHQRRVDEMAQIEERA